MVCVVGQQFAEVADTGGSQRLDRSGGHGVGANPLRAEAESEVARGGFQAGLGQAHGVVVRHRALGAKVGQRDQRRIVALEQQRASGLGQCRIAVGRNVVGDAESVTRDAVEEVAFDGFGRRIGDGVYQTVEPFPVGAEVGEQLLYLGVVGDIAGEHQRTVKFCGEFGNPLEKAVVLVGECQFGAFAVASLGNAVCDGMLGQKPGNQNALVSKKSHVFSHINECLVSFSKRQPSAAIRCAL